MLNRSGLVIVLAAIHIQACAQVEHKNTIAQPVDQVLRAGIGDAIVTINSEKSLPNAFGRADLFGRTTPTGLITVQYLGTDGTNAKFVRRAVDINTGATTMNSSPIVIPNTQTTTTSGYIGTTPVAATSTTYGPPTVIPANPPAAQVMPQAEVVFLVDLSKEREFVVSGKLIEVIDATPSSITYRIR
ncbi:MAG: hypothetical protein Q7V31_06275 [Parvibaculum sp.]|uniref:hypothetical protein n=1 Tax=Parvibaculum sp. TaxID=2024848 RepID=UPI00271D21D4|nr:hypothetical protein [Parvibaculum sp.]MDO8838518.1 hypothetical protein [Parvibaculum sp.]